MCCDRRPRSISPLQRESKDPMQHLHSFYMHLHRLATRGILQLPLFSETIIHGFAGDPVVVPRTWGENNHDSWLVWLRHFLVDGVMVRS